MGIIQIPQGMAYSLTAGLPAVNGLYATFFQCLLYFFLGTSKHISPGTFAITSLMTFNAIDSYEGILYPYEDNTTHQSKVDVTNFISEDIEQARIFIATGLAFFSGLFLILLSILNFGFVAKYLSDPVVSAMSIGAVYQIIASQLKSLLGVNSHRTSLPTVFIGVGIGKILNFFSNIFIYFCTFIRHL